MNESNVAGSNNGADVVLPEGMPAFDMGQKQKMEQEQTQAKPVLITIVGSQWHNDDEPLVTKNTTEGRLYNKGDKTVLTYHMSVANGFKNTFATLTMKKDSVDLVWNGEHMMKMVFSQGKRHISNLNMPEGVLSLGIFTTELSMHKTNEGGRVNIRYSLDGPDMQALNTKLDIDYRYV